MMTEAEAREKWCPHVRFSQWAEGILNNRGDLNGKHDCLASECMAWRWCNGEEMWSHVTPTGEKFCASTLASLAKAEAEGYIPLGYCGLAGKP